MLREALDDGPSHHDQGADHDRPPPPPLLGYPRSDGHAEYGPKLVARVDKPEQTGLDLEVALIIDAAAAKV